MPRSSLTGFEDPLSVLLAQQTQQATGLPVAESRPSSSLFETIQAIANVLSLALPGRGGVGQLPFLRLPMKPGQKDVHIMIERYPKDVEGSVGKIGEAKKELERFAHSEFPGDENRLQELIFSIQEGSKPKFLRPKEFTLGRPRPSDISKGLPRLVEGDDPFFVGRILDVLLGPFMSNP